MWSNLKLVCGRQSKLKWGGLGGPRFFSFNNITAWKCGARPCTNKLMMTRSSIIEGLVPVSRGLCTYVHDSTLLHVVTT